MLQNQGGNLADCETSSDRNSTVVTESVCQFVQCHVTLMIAFVLKLAKLQPAGASQLLDCGKQQLQKMLELQVCLMLLSQGRLLLQNSL